MEGYVVIWEVKMGMGESKTKGSESLFFQDEEKQ